MALSHGCASVADQCHTMTPAFQPSSALACAKYVFRSLPDTQPLLPSPEVRYLPTITRLAGTPAATISATDVPGKTAQSAADRLNRPSYVV